MLIILPPSETKISGGDHPSLQLEKLSFPQLNSIREDIAHDLAALDPQQALSILGISEKLLDEAASNTQLFHSPTMPALLRYTGVLYNALDAASLPEHAWQRLAIGSALFGLIRADDLIPHYRLSGNTKLPRRGRSLHHDGSFTATDTANATVPTMKSRWGTSIKDTLSDIGELIIDLRSGTYQQLGKLSSAVTVRVESCQPDGTRKVVSHFNKHYKGQLARILALSTDQADSIDDVIHISRAAGLRIEHNNNKPTELTLVV
ncbi:peroxide stress protein YaaA [Corynebacterium sp. sy017]|uniref:peroxide stress protein YaaA n=1 Tax=unclassified Corynebacterium TaxID=2624378 RepID=UPI001184D420|nr:MULTISPECIES: peroxide stress protein YaaA [unclassified Corynebacterium]MBP3087832.1 peroxide stress protein YaaA [Corynebacterium sp. sy017]QDZ42801.1 peroxide stress protein YaaA [Corynebacterium sp. sy039]TSD92375.1 peroxide stress protein YaaA [Corynebacterium sp. SY003]